MTEDTFQTRYQQLADLRIALQTAFGEMTAEDFGDVAMLAQVAATVVVPLMEERTTLVRDLAAANEDLAEVRAQCGELAEQCEAVAARLLTDGRGGQQT